MGVIKAETDPRLSRDPGISGTHQSLADIIKCPGRKTDFPTVRKGAVSSSPLEAVLQHESLDGSRMSIQPQAIDSGKQSFLLPYHATGRKKILLPLTLTNPNPIDPSREWVKEQLRAPPDLPLLLPPAVSTNPGVTQMMVEGERRWRRGFPNPLDGRGKSALRERLRTQR